MPLFLSQSCFPNCVLLSSPFLSRPEGPPHQFEPGTLAHVLVPHYSWPFIQSDHSTHQVVNQVLSVWHNLGFKVRPFASTLQSVPSAISFAAAVAISPGKSSKSKLEYRSPTQQILLWTVSHDLLYVD
jgi:hypothetical protein